MKLILAVLLVLALHPTPSRAAVSVDDPWMRLQRQLATVDKGMEPPPGSTQADPWRRLQEIYLPFTLHEDKAADGGDKTAQRSLHWHIQESLKRFLPIIREAAARFDVPPQIIAAVIMVESGGNPMAESTTSSAKGLMQTIASTFELAVVNNKKIMTPNPHPFKPRSSILAGTWYLSQMFEQTVADNPGQEWRRTQIDDWQKALEYYYAGPGNGRKKANKVIIYADGARVLIDKAAYAGKVLRWAGHPRDSCCQIGKI